ncbi:helix-turn-helix domain-containing protein [Nocardia fluminea]|uniref:winged helix-turn-helix transcriptional regulator n=1 Tax=Nocardia fluminea TaxID=134984 RepID=UPI0033F4850B
MDSVGFETHATSQACANVAHQTETHRWDTELVPTESGRSQRPDTACPVEVALSAVSGRWTTLVLRELMHGPSSFTELADRLPEISPKVLTDRLRSLRDGGLVRQQRLAGFPTRTRYALTSAGEALRPLLIELYRTGERLHRLR